MAIVSSMMVFGDGVVRNFKVSRGKGDRLLPLFAAVTPPCCCVLTFIRLIDVVRGPLFGGNSDIVVEVCVGDKIEDEICVSKEGDCEV